MKSSIGKILHLIDTGGPGGAETVFAQVATGLASRGYEATAVISRDAWLAGRLREGGIEPKLLATSGSLDWRYLTGILDLIRTERPIALVTHLLGPAVYGSLAGILTHTPVISVLHGQSDLGPTERFVRAKATLIRRGTRKVVFVSEQLKADLLPRLRMADDAHCAVIPNGVDVARIATATPARLRAELGLDSDVFLVGAVGNLRRPKAYDVMLRAARLACDADPRLRFVIAGDTATPLHDELLSLRAELHLGGLVHFLGLRTDVPAVLRALDAYVLSSSTEGFSIACCEAMAAGVPVVSTRSGGPEQILDGGRCGVLVPTAAPRALADAIVRLAASADLRRSLASAGLARVEAKYGIAGMLTAYENLLESR